MDITVTHIRNLYSEGRESAMAKNRIIEKVNEQLISLSDVFTSQVGCIGFWGEVEVPECLCKELENKEEEE